MNRPEEQLQRAAVEYLHVLERQGVLFFFHPANGEHRNKITGAKLKGLGVRPGVADLVVLFPGGRVGFIELKSPKGRMSFDQRAFQARCDDMAFPYAVCRSLDEVRGTIDAWRIGAHDGVAAA